MNQIPAAILVLIAWAQLSIQATIPADLYYNAGVVEFRPSTEVSYDDRVNDNLNGYLEIIASTEAEPLDIIVFPESTLNNEQHLSFVPNPDDGLVVPCDAVTGVYHNILVQLSCAARNYRKYIVINLTEKEWCPSVPEDKRPCATSGLNRFNTNVVFDRNGAVISRYRKVHLYGENKNSTLVPEFGWFDTDFGVRFGHFICFDILFYSPAQEMVKTYGIKDFIFPTMWFSQLPFLTGVQIQHAWSYGNDVNLLAAGSSNPAVGSTGSGIYNGRNGSLVAASNQGTGVRSLYVAQVPKSQGVPMKIRMKRSSSSRLSKPDIFFKRDYLEQYESVLLDLNATNSSLSQDLCYSNSEFCCSFQLKWQPLPVEVGQHYHYRLAIYDGLRNEEAAETNELKNCALISCTSSDIKDCGKVFAFDSDVIFENITITATFPKTDTFLLMPNSLRAEDLMPVTVDNFEWTEQETESNEVRIRYSLNTTTSNVLTFSIYGNYYDSVSSEKPANDGDGAAAVAISVFCAIAVFVVHSFIV